MSIVKDRKRRGLQRENELLHERQVRGEQIRRARREREPRPIEEEAADLDTDYRRAMTDE